MGSGPAEAAASPDAETLAGSAASDSTEKDLDAPGDPAKRSTGVEGRNSWDGRKPKSGFSRVVRIVLGSVESMTFFAAEALSGMGRGIIDTFLFIWWVRLVGSVRAVGASASRARPGLGRLSRGRSPAGWCRDGGVLVIVSGDVREGSVWFVPTGCARKLAAW